MTKHQFKVEYHQISEQLKYSLGDIDENLVSLLVLNGFGYTNPIFIQLDDHYEVTVDQLVDVIERKSKPDIHNLTESDLLPNIVPFKQNEIETRLIKLLVQDQFLAYAQVTPNFKGNVYELCFKAYDAWCNALKNEGVEKSLDEQYRSRLKAFKSECIKKSESVELEEFLLKTVVDHLEAHRGHYFRIRSYGEVELDLKKRLKKKEKNYKGHNKVVKYRENVSDLKPDSPVLELSSVFANGEAVSIDNIDEKFDFPIFKYLLKFDAIGKDTLEFVMNINQCDTKLSDDDLTEVLTGISLTNNFANAELAQEEGLNSQMMIALMDGDEDGAKVIGLLKIFSKWSEPLFSFKKTEVLSIARQASERLVELEAEIIEKNLIALANSILDIKKSSGREEEELSLGEIKEYQTQVLELKTLIQKLPNHKTEVPLLDLEKELGFKRNSKSTIYLNQISIRNTFFFSNINWKFHNKMNILIGKNGYGKSYLFRLIISMMQQNEKVVKSFLQKEHQENPEISINITRSNLHDREEELSLHRGLSRFITKSGEAESYSLGPIPILAIPDVRFVRRSNVLPAIGMPINGELKRIGAENYLNGIEYQDMIGEFLSELCITFESKRADMGKGVDPKEIFMKNQPFKMLQSVIQILTDDESFEFISITKKKQASGFEFLIYMNDAHNSGSRRIEKEEKVAHAVPIQHLSQGTISLVAIFGMIHRYLLSLNNELRYEKNIGDGSGIVFIDEIDAHLHPSIQLKVLDLLKKTFPRVQFFITSHSPSILMNQFGSASIKQLHPGLGKTGYELIDKGEGKGNYTYLDVTRKFFGASEFNNQYYEYNLKSFKLSEYKREAEEIRAESGENDKYNELMNLINGIEEVIARKKVYQDQEIQNVNLKIKIRKLEQELKELKSKRN